MDLKFPIIGQPTAPESSCSVVTDNTELDKQYFEINHSGGGIICWSFYLIKQGAYKRVSKANNGDFDNFLWDQLLEDLAQRVQTSFKGHKTVAATAASGHRNIFEEMLLFHRASALRRNFYHTTK